MSEVVRNPAGTGSIEDTWSALPAGQQPEWPDAAELSAVEGTGPFGPAERPMGGYLSLPSGMAQDQAAQWVEKARSHVGSLPPKVKKPKKTRAG